AGDNQGPRGTQEQPRAVISPVLALALALAAPKMTSSLPGETTMHDPFQTFLAEYAAYGYPVLFFGVLLENAGIPVPGETAVLVAGFLASSAGGGHFQLLLVILITFIAAVIGDTVGFWLGHRFARWLLHSGRRLPFLP